jgi:hypothetical protein
MTILCNNQKFFAISSLLLESEFTESNLGYVHLKFIHIKSIIFLMVNKSTVKFQTIMRTRVTACINLR